MNDMESQPPATVDECDVQTIRRSHVFIDNIPYLVMIMLGAAIFWTGFTNIMWKWTTAGLYAVCGGGGAIWIIYFICPYCRFYDTQLCPCGYGQLAAKLRPRKAPDQFARQFKKHIPVIVPLWFAPLIAGGIALIDNFSWGPVILLAAFVINSFIVLPLVSRRFGCSSCPQKQTCPWMGNCKQA